MSDKEQENGWGTLVRSEAYSYNEMLQAYQRGRIHQKKYGDPGEGDAPDFSGFIRGLVSRRS
jgi:hypothetical protein